MRFWDTSAVVPLLIRQRTTAAVQRAYETDDGMLVWWTTEVECASALARLEHERRTPRSAIEAAWSRLDEFTLSWEDVVPVDSIRRAARRVVRVHRLRAADALQLAAAIEAAGDDRSMMPFVTLDNRLAEAAHREGLSVLVPGGREP